MAITLNGSTGVTYPAGGTDNVAGSGVGTTDTQTLTNKTIASLTTTGTATFGGLINTGSTGQIQFPATQNPSSDANTLDDYEEGTWTPSFTGGASNPTINGLAAYGYYTKVGNLVTLSWFTTRTSSSGGSGTLYISGLPFASGSVSSTPFHGTATVESVVFGTSSYLTAIMGGTSGLILFAPVANNTTFGYLTCSALNGGAGWFCGSISYRTA